MNSLCEIIDRIKLFNNNSLDDENNSGFIFVSHTYNTLLIVLFYYIIDLFWKQLFICHFINEKYNTNKQDDLLFFIYKHEEKKLFKKTVGIFKIAKLIIYILFYFFSLE